MESCSWWVTPETSCSFLPGHIQFARNRGRRLLDFAYNLHNVIDTLSIFRQFPGSSVATAALRGVMTDESLLSHPPTRIDLHPDCGSQGRHSSGKLGWVGYRPQQPGWLLKGSWKGERFRNLSSLPPSATRPTWLSVQSSDSLEGEGGGGRQANK